MSITSLLQSQPGLFIGRETELAEIVHLLADPACRLLTLVGPGGSGKTRLAMQVASEMHTDFENGVRFVPLVQLGAVEHILPAIVTVLGLRVEGQETLKQQVLDYLHSRHMLLILDNFEHLLDGADLVAEILDAAPALKVMTTSRETLKLKEEWVRHVTGLRFPAEQEVAPHEEYSAVQLFVECARRVREPFSLDHEWTHVICICQLVEGLPLGIELAAAWLRTLTCEQIAQEIERNIDFLSTPLRNVPERHRSMRAVFEHSLKQLRADEQAVFAKMSAFRGGFRQEAAEAVTGASLRMLSALVDKSLVRLSATGRYDIHELLRQYGAEKLELVGDTEQTRAAHSAYYLDYVRRWEPHIKGRGQVEALAALEADFENIRVAWNRAVEQKHYAAIDGALETLSIFSSEDMRSDSAAYLELLRHAWERFTPPPGSEPPPLFWHICTYYYLLHFRSKEAKSEFERCLEVARDHQDQKQVALCLTGLGHVNIYEYRDFQSALDCFKDSIAYLSNLKDSYHLARNLIMISHCLWLLGRWAEGEKYLHQGFEMSRETGDKARIGQCLQLIAMEQVIVGNVVVGEHFYREALEIWRELRFPGGVAHVYALLSLDIHFACGDFTAAKAQAETALKMARDCNYRNWAVRASLDALGIVISVQGDYVVGQRFLDESIPLTAHMSFSANLDWGLSIAACGLGDYPAARRSLFAALHYAAKGNNFRLRVWSLPVAAVLDAHDGHSQRAVELLGLAFTFPANLIGWMDQWPLLNRLRAELETTLGKAGYAGAWEAGQKLELEPVIAEILDRLRPIQPLLPVSLSLPDPLTDRELEVIRLIAEGLSNREIAERLVVGMSTVSKHINHLYSKLAVTGRMQAVVRARDLKLL